MARAKKETALTPEERLQAALVPDWEWPYKLPENWCWVKASAVARIYTGNSISEKIKADKYAGQQEGLLFIATKDIGFDNAIDYETDIRIPDYPNFKIAPANTALLCIEGGSAGRKVGFVNREVCFGNKLCAFAAEKVNSKFIYYILQSQYFIQQFNNRKHGLIGGVSVNNLAEIGFPLSPLAEQQRIVDRIESLFAELDEAKEKAQAVVDSFETRKAAILHKAFTGELTAKWREEHGVGMESWEHHQFSDLCAIVRGGSPRPAGDPRYYDGNIPFMKVADITRNDSPYVSKVEYSIKEEGLKKTRMVEANTLLLTNSGATLGVPAITTIRTTFNDGIAAFIGLDIDSLLFYYYFWTSKTDFLRSINMGAAQPNLNTKLIGEVEIDVPQTAERVEIARVLNALLSKERQAKEAAEAVLDQIDLMKKSILARAFRGELGTNDPSEESAVELLKRTVEQENGNTAKKKVKTKRIVIPTEIKLLISNANEEAIIKLLLKDAPKPVSIQEIMSISKEKFELMDALQFLERKQIVLKCDFDKYSLMR